MATKGAKPKVAHLRLIDGTHRPTRHGKADAAKKQVDAAAVQFGKLLKPSYLKGEAAAAWKEFIEPATWLDGSKKFAAVAFCELWQEFRFAPVSFNAARHGQMRAYGNELGLIDERNRTALDDKPKDEFFDE